MPHREEDLYYGPKPATERRRQGAAPATVPQRAFRQGPLKNPITDWFYRLTGQQPSPIRETPPGALPPERQPSDEDFGLPPIGFSRSALQGSISQEGERQRQAGLQATAFSPGASRGEGGEDLTALMQNAPQEDGDGVGAGGMPDPILASLITRAMQGDQSILADLAAYITEGHWETVGEFPDPVTNRWVPGGLSPRGQYVKNILDAATDIQREDAVLRQSQQQAMFQAALSNPFAFGALNALMGRNYAPLMGGLPSIGFQMPEAGGQLFPGGTPTLGALNQAGPEGLQFLQALLGFQGISPSELSRTAGAVTPSTFRGFGQPVGGGTERPLIPMTFPDVRPPSREREMREAEAGPALGRAPGTPRLPAGTGSAATFTAPWNQPPGMAGLPPIPTPPAAGAPLGEVAESPFAKLFAEYKAMLERGEITPEQFDSLVGALLGGE